MTEEREPQLRKNGADGIGSDDPAGSGADFSGAASGVPTAHPAPELAERAAALRIAVIGGGIGGLVAANECAAVGMHVTVFERSDAPGGAVRRGEADGLSFDAGAESFATRGGHVRALVDDLGIGDRVVDAAPGGAWVAGFPGGPAPLPQGGLLGIPENPFADDVRRVIGWSGAWRAYLDRVRPPLTIGHDRSLGRLVRKRMGERVLDRLVAPISTGVYSAHPDDIDTDAAAPALNAALTRVGSLSGAVAVIRGDGAGKTPGAAVQGLDGGMSTLVDALVARLGLLGAEVRTEAGVEALERTDRGWIVRPESSAEEPAESATADVAADTAESAGPEVFDAVVVAVDEGAARRLLSPHAPGLDAVAAAGSPRIEIVTLVLDAPALDAAPRGSGVLTVPGTGAAKALTHSTAKWPWLRRAAGSRHVVRVSFGSQGEDPATASLDDDAAAALALAEASALLGVALDPSALRGSHRSRFVQAQPAAVLGAAERRDRAAKAIEAVPSLAATGAWLAGTGLAQVVPHARTAADGLRHALLWGDGTASAG